MRGKLLGTIAAVAAGTGAAWGQAPARVVPPPAPIGPAGVMPGAGYDANPIGMAQYDGGLMPPGGMGGMPMGMPGMGGMPMGMPGMGDPSGGPGYPPGVHGDPSWQPPFNSLSGLGVNSRFAPRAWTEFEYLMMFARSQPTSYPFVTTSAPAAGGIIGNTSTTNLHAMSDLGYNLINGFRVGGGMFTDEARRFGYYGSGFVMENKANVFTTFSDASGQPLLARPFINAATGAQSALAVSFPTFANGNVTIYSGSQVWGVEGGPIINLFRSCPDEGTLWSVNLLTGFRFLQLSELLRMQQFTSLVGQNTLPFDGKLYGAPSTIQVNDEFAAVNRFYGGQVGLQTEMRRNRWQFGLTGKIAIGVMNERLDINGTSALVNGTPTAGNNSISRAGLFANATNIGRYNRDEFAVVPEFHANLGYAWTSWLSGSIGYNFLYANRVARPGTQYNVAVNPALIPTSPAYGLGANIPVTNPAINSSDYWLQGVSFGLNIRY